MSNIRRRNVRTLRYQVACLLLSFFLFTCFPSFALVADPPPIDIEYQIKAAYLYKFVNYVEWPASTFPQVNSPVTIAVAGADAIELELNKIKSRRPAEQRMLEIRHLSPDDSLAGVQVLFIGKREGSRLQQWLKRTQFQSILTVTETDDGLDSGGIINFISRENRIRFEISVAHAERSNLRISSRLLGVAQKIEAKGP